MTISMYDPVTTSLGQVVDGFSLIEPLLKVQIRTCVTLNKRDAADEARREAILQAFINSIGYLRDFQIEFAGRLNHLTVEFFSFEARVELASKTLDSVVVEFGRELGLEEFRENLDWPKKEFQLLLPLVASLTPGMIALQGHVGSLISAGPVGAMREIEKLYAPLFAFRDEYFAVPRTGMLGEYLKIAEEFTAKPRYKEIGIRRASDFKLTAYLQGEVDRYASDLEILSLMETLDLPKEAR